MCVEALTCLLSWVCMPMASGSQVCDVSNAVHSVPMHDRVEISALVGLMRAQVKPDCSNFDEAQAWPLLLDNYVEWRRKQS